MAAEKAVLVAVRSRPLLESDGCEFNSSLKFYEQDKEVVCQDKSFKFNYVFPPDSSNLTVYKTAVADRLEYIFNGYNLTIFAYGQTGSGKSHTMGTSDVSVTDDNMEQGIIPLSVTDIFNEIKNRGNNHFSVKASFLEVYKEDVYDLLSQKTETCKIQEDVDGTQKVANLMEIPVKSAHDVLNVLRKGCHARRTGSTALNEHSSRSHSIFILVIEQNPNSLEAKKSRFQLVDLAGSERAERSRTAGVRFKEGCDINKGLLALGKVISALCEDKPHVPYRDSKLTRLLMDSLGGNSYTLMIACVSPSELSSEETLSTLRYASSARNIKNKPVLNTDPPHIQIEKLKRQVEYLQSQLYKKCSPFSITSTVEDVSNMKQENEKLQLQLRKSYSDIVTVTEKLIKAEEKVESLNDKLNDARNGLQMYMLHNECDTALPELSELLEHIKLPEIEYKDLVPKSVAIADFPEKVASDEEEAAEEDADEEEADMEQKMNSINANLEKKKEMMKHIFVLNEVVKCNEFTENDLKSMKAQIEKLEEEKVNLQKKLKSTEIRYADECQKRYTECTCEIVGLKKKILRSEYMQKIKAENQQKLEKFKLEVQELKRAKVKLIKKMQTESEKFRKQQVANQREVAKLKQNERKKEREILVLRNNLEKQVNVFRQKMEKVKSLNKRYKEALNKREGSSAFQRKRESIGQENLQELLSKELDVEVLRKLASVQYEHAKENMSDIAEKIQQIQEAGDPSSSLENWFIGLNLESENLNNIKLEAKHPPGKKADRWSVINSMSDAKVAIDILFEKCISNYVEAYHQNEMKTSELLSLKEKLQNKDKMTADEIKNLKEKIASLKQEIELVKEDYEKKLDKERYERDIAVIQCLKNVTDVMNIDEKGSEKTDEDLLNKLKFQEKEIERLNERFAEYTKKCEEVDYWKEEYNKLNNKRSKRRRYLSDFPAQSSSLSQDEAGGSIMFEYLDEVLDESFTTGHVDDTKDPDWRLTPINKQRKRTLRETTILKNLQEDTLPSKRPLLGCKCPGDCKTMRCGCRKRHKICDAECGCSSDLCMNIASEEEFDKSK